MSLRKLLSGRTLDGHDFSVAFDTDASRPNALKWSGPSVVKNIDPKSRKRLARVSEVTLFRTNTDESAFAKFVFAPKRGGQDIDLDRDNVVELQFETTLSVSNFSARLSIRGWIRSFIGDNGEDQNTDDVKSAPGGQTLAFPLRLELRAFRDGKRDVMCVSYAEIGDRKIDNGKLDERCRIESLVGLEGEQRGARDPLRLTHRDSKGRLVAEPLDGAVDVLERPLPLLSRVFPSWKEFGSALRFGATRLGFATIESEPSLQTISPSRTITLQQDELRIGDTRMRLARDEHLTVRQRLLDAQSGEYELTVELTAHQFALAWNKTIADRFQRSLRSLRDGHRLSFAPRLAEVASDDPSFAAGWRMRVRDFTTARRSLAPSDFELRSIAGAPADVIAIQPGRLQPVRAEGFEVDSSFASFATHGGSPLTLRLTAAPPQAEAGEGELAEIRFRLLHGASDATSLQTVRLGALDLRFPSRIPAAPHDPTTLTCTASTREGAAANADEQLWDLSWIGELAVDAVVPGGQDRAPGDRDQEFVPDGSGAEGRPREQPIVIVEEPVHAADDGARYLLRVEERAVQSRSHSVKLSLLVDPRSEDAQSAVKASSSAVDRSIVVIDREPLLFARISQPDFTAGSSSRDTQEIGNWSNDDEIGGERWELMISTDSALVTLPPQGVGETTLRGAELAPPTRADAPVDFAFTPAASVQLETNEFGQRFTEPGWNLRRLLGFAGQRSPGARMLRAQFELLYGMRCDVESNTLRLAELSARIGRLAPRFDNGSAHGQLGQFRTRWNSLLASYQARLAILEPWADGQRGTLRLEDGVSYHLRAGEAANPTGASAPADKLRGGALWGYDSPGAYSDRLRRPDSSSGVLSRPWFSVLGGAGHQKAVFDRGLTTIYSDTGLGRTSYYSLELLGRIGVFWNLAKLVSVYERSVVPTAQFEAGQRAHLGRPMLRLVKQYIEILEPKRDFPDNAAEPITRGFVKGVRFRSTIIPVGTGAGWQFDVPGGAVRRLWNKSADPAIYPKPQVELQFAADASGAADTVSTPFDDPSQLVFYQRFGGDLPDVHDWPQVAGVDFAQGAAAPTPPNQIQLDPLRPDDTLPDDAPTPAGLADFTFVLARADRGANLVAERSGRALSVVLENVTIVRKNATLSLVRAFGESPRTAGLEFNRRRIGYYFDEAKRVVDVTPLAALVQRAGDDLKAFSLRIPTRQMLDRLLPDGLERFELSTILPDLGGLRFKSLLPGLRLPPIANRNIVVSHGLDPQTRRAWLQANIDVPLSGQNTMFSFGPIALVLRDATLFATARLQTDRGGGPRRVVRGRVRGDLDLVIAGTTFLTFANTSIEFDDSGEVQIDLSPDRVRLHGFLGVLTDIIATVNVNPAKLAEAAAKANEEEKQRRREAEEGDDKKKDRDAKDKEKSKDKPKGKAGFELNVLREGLIPTGVEAVLTYEMPDIAVGAFTLSNLVLGATFSLEVELENREFWLGVGASIGEKQAPFALTVLFLGGGGWVSVGLRYAPLSQRIQTHVSVGIVATASLEFSLGPIKGGVAAYLGLFVEYSTDSREGGRLVVGVMFLVVGEVDVLGLISISMSLLLEATYERSSTESVIVARGELSLEIEICFFLTIEVSVSAEYRFQAPGGQPQTVAAAAPTPALDPVDQYVGMLE